MKSAMPAIDGAEAPLGHDLLQVVRGHGDRRREVRGLEVDGDQRAEPEHVVFQRLDDRVEDREEHEDDGRPLEGPAEEEDQAHHQEQGHERAARAAPASAFVMTVALPSRAKMAPKTFEATARNRTMLEVVIVLNTAVLSPRA